MNSVGDESNKMVEKRQKIQWDEVTIAEHDKERGTRQKIEEAPTPYRYLSESDESDADCRKMRTSSKDSSGSEGHKHAHVMFSSHLNSTIPNKNTSSPSNAASTAASSSNASTMISDSWEAVNAKLQYEKHLQDLNDRSNNNNDDDSASASHHDVLMDRHNQRREFYSSSCGSNNSSSSSNNSSSSSSHHDSGGGSHPAVVSMSHKPPHRSKQPSFQLLSNGAALRIDDIQTNFGEILNPAPAAFSPQFTRKHYRSNDRLNTLTTSNSGDGDDESVPTDQQDTATVSSTTSSHHYPHHNHHHHHHHVQVRPKTVFIPVIATVTCDRDADDDNNNNTADADGTYVDVDGDDDDVSGTINSKHNNDKSKFLNKRAVHYNEYKVLQAMRAKMKAEEEEEEDEEDEE